jgi:hypothetical protein
MADQRSRSGKKRGKRGQSNPAAPDQQQTTRQNQTRTESSDPSDQPRKYDESVAPESGDKKTTGTTL